MRLCKGIYVEPPDHRLPGLRGGARELRRVPRRAVAPGAYVGIATHDDWLVAEALRTSASGLAPDQYEFQMLLGVRPDGRPLVAAGHRLRIYVPFGTHWYEYSMRRLQENPRIAGYVARDTLAPLFGRPRARQARRR